MRILLFTKPIISIDRPKKKKNAAFAPVWLDFT